MQISITSCFKSKLHLQVETDYVLSMILVYTIQANMSMSLTHQSKWPTYSFTKNTSWWNK